MKPMLAAALCTFALMAAEGGAWAQAPAVAPAPATVLREGTQIHIATRDELTSKTAKQGDPVELVVTEPVVVDGITVVPAGSRAIGEVAHAKGNGLLGKSGKLDINVSEVVAGGRNIPVRGQRDAKGQNGAVGAVGAAVVFLPLAIVVHGKEAKIEAGTKVDVYVDRDVPVVTGVAAAPAEPPVVAPPQG